MNRKHNGVIKVCKKCQVEKPLADFYSRKSYPGNNRGQSYHHSCKSCMSKHKLWKKANMTPDQKLAQSSSWRSYAASHRQIVKNTVFSYYGGYICKCCGETERQFMTIDHIHNNGADFRRMIGGTRLAAGMKTYLWLIRNDFPEGVQVLCMNCNHGKRMNKGVCPHQVRSNDYPVTGVESSDSKRSAPRAFLGEDIVSSALKNAAAASAGLLYLN